MVRTLQRLTGPLSGLLARAWRAPGLAAAVVLLVALIAAAAAAAGVSAWAEYNYWAARRALDAHHYARARAHVDRCLRLRPGSALAHLVAARLARRTGHFGEAGDQLDEARRLLGVSPAIDLERAMLVAEAEDPGPLERLAMGYVRQHCPDDPANLDVLAGHPDGPAILEALAHGFTNVHGYSAAGACVEAWLRCRPDDTEALLCRAGLQEVLMRPDRAVDDYRRVLAVEPDHAEAHFRLATVLLSSAQPAGALEQYRWLEQHGPAREEADVGAAECQMMLGRADEAEAVLAGVLARDPGNVVALAQRGKLALDRGDAAGAEGWLRGALATEPYQPRTNYLLYQALERQGKREEARRQQAVVERLNADVARMMEIAQVELADRPADVALLHELGAIYLRNGEEQTGLHWLGKALRQDPGHRPTLRLLARHFTEAGDREKARSYEALLRRRE